jgi:hypothetical protein
MHEVHDPTNHIHATELKFKLQINLQQLPCSRIRLSEINNNFHLLSYFINSLYSAILIMKNVQLLLLLVKISQSLQWLDMGWPIRLQFLARSETFGFHNFRVALRPSQSPIQFVMGQSLVMSYSCIGGLSCWVLCCGEQKSLKRPDKGLLKARLKELKMIKSPSGTRL